MSVAAWIIAGGVLWTLGLTFVLALMRAGSDSFDLHHHPDKDQP